MERPKHKFILPKCGDSMRLIETLAYEISYLWDRVNALEDRLAAITPPSADAQKRTFNRAAL